MIDRVRMACRRALTAPIRLYKRRISPGLGWHCRFTPTCSEYAQQAILQHGCIKGLLLAAWRLARCNPLGRWGFDPVPPAFWILPPSTVSVAPLITSMTNIAELPP